MQSQTQHVAGCDVVDAGMKPALQKVPVCRLKMKVTEIPLEVYSHVCVKLNLKRNLRFDDHKILAEKVGLSKEKTALIEQDYPNPTDEILKTWSVRRASRSDEGLTLETSAFLTFHSGNSIFINSFDKTKFLFSELTLPDWWLSILQFLLTVSIETNLFPLLDYLINNSLVRIKSRLS